MQVPPVAVIHLDRDLRSIYTRERDPQNYPDLIESPEISCHEFWDVESVVLNRCLLLSKPVWGLWASSNRRERLFVIALR